MNLEAVFLSLFHIIHWVILVKLFDYLDRYLIDKDYKITIYPDRVHIINYLEIEDFSNTRVAVRHDGGTTILLGSDLVVSKMEDNELLITGKIKNIEV